MLHKTLIITANQKVEEGEKKLIREVRGRDLLVWVCLQLCCRRLALFLAPPTAAAAAGVSLSLSLAEATGVGQRRGVI